MDVFGRSRLLVARTTEWYAAVQQQLAEGKSRAAIGRPLRLDHSTVRRFARAGSLDELLAKAVNRTSILDEYMPYLHQRWHEGCHDVPQLRHELRERGFTGDIQCVRRHAANTEALPLLPAMAPLHRPQGSRKLGRRFVPPAQPREH
ncbi:hypothetical protein [Streptomyces mirabilis]|uniref:hypothetical protein n=1 Tax=Streptomyces mirabilis TaxID=68239 RepID=UPI00331DC6A2